jgi:CheY-like chemotaxis protein
MKVLIIDDEEDARSICSMSLGLLAGDVVFEAANGREGLKKAEEHLPDVIILDLLMPEMDGTETLRNLRKNPKTAKIPVIFLTVKGRFSEFDELKDLGALGVITKPFDPTKLSGQIQEILNKAKPQSTGVEYG